MDSDSGDDFVGSRRRKSSRPRKATLRQKLLEESGSSDDDFVTIPKKRALPDKKREVAGDRSQRLSRDDKLFNQNLKKALVESKSLSGQQEPATVSLSSQQESLSGSESEEVSDYIPDENSDSDEDFGPSLPSPPLAKAAKNSTKQNGKTKTSAKTAQKKQQGSNCKKEVEKTSAVKTSPKKQQISSNCKPLVRHQTVDSSSLPGSKHAVTGSRPMASRPAMAPNTVTTGPKATATGGDETLSRHTVAKKRTKWVPPSRVDGKTVGPGSISSSPLGRTTGAPVIRVGLSRRAPIKPLHQTHKLAPL